jgi:hypothetical protein
MIFWHLPGAFAYRHGRSLIVRSGDVRLEVCCDLFASESSPEHLLTESVYIAKDYLQGVAMATTRQLNEFT